MSTCLAPPAVGAYNARMKLGIRAAPDLHATLTAEAERLNTSPAGLVAALLDAWVRADPYDRDQAIAIALDVHEYGARFAEVVGRTPGAYTEAARAADLDTHQLLVALWDVWSTLPEADRVRLSTPHAWHGVAEGTANHRVLSLLRNGPVASGDIGRALGWSVPACGRYLAHLHHRGLIDHAGHGRWQATTRGRLAAEHPRKPRLSRKAKG